MKRNILLLLAILILFNHAFNQENNNQFYTSPIYHFKDHFIGLNVGLTTGKGYTYRYFPEKRGIQFTLLPLHTDYFTNIGLGLTYLKEIKSYDQSRLLLFLSNSVNKDSYSDHVKYNTGLGFGADFVCNGLIINFMFGHGLFDIFESFQSLPTLELGIFYNF
ncbi:hypothetical protein ACFLTE_07200 [Bacteroidota bacterium]